MLATQAELGCRFADLLVWRWGNRDRMGGSLLDPCAPSPSRLRGRLPGGGVCRAKASSAWAMKPAKLDWPKGFWAGALPRRSAVSARDSPRFRVAGLLLETETTDARAATDGLASLEAAVSGGRSAVAMPCKIGNGCQYSACW